MPPKNKKEKTATQRQKLQDRNKFARSVVRKNVIQTRKTLRDWNSAQSQALMAEDPKRTRLAELYNEILKDGHLFSQMQLRYSYTTSADFNIMLNGEANEELTSLVRNSLWFYPIIEQILSSHFWGHTLTELTLNNGNLIPTLIPHANIVPDNGRFYPDATEDYYIEYRNVAEYGVSLIEFGDDNNLGILNKAIPYVLFKRFTTSSWSELIETFGIPPRTIKTDTTNIGRLAQLESMMSSVGSNPWLIADIDEQIEWGTSVVTNGEIFNLFISKMKEEISLIIMGAQLGQDTKNGNRSKEESSQNLLKGLIKNDKRFVQNQFNAKVIPALEYMGILPQGCTLFFSKEVDTEALWKIVSGAMTKYDFNIDWLNNTFGLQIEALSSASNKDNNDSEDTASLNHNSQEKIVRAEVNSFFV